MSLTFNKPGWAATITAPTTLTQGQFVVAGEILCSVTNPGGIPSGFRGQVSVVGRHIAPKLSGDSWAAGERLGWDASEGAVRRTFTPASGDLTGAGIAADDAAAGSTTCLVQLTPSSSALVP